MDLNGESYVFLVNGAASISALQKATIPSPFYITFIEIPYRPLVLGTSTVLKTSNSKDFNALVIFFRSPF